MVDILYKVHRPMGNKKYISSNKVAAVVFPCTSFEEDCLINELVYNYKFDTTKLECYLISSLFEVGSIDVAGEQKVIQVEVSPWNVKGVWVCCVGAIGDIFSYLMADEWVRKEFLCKYGKNKPAIFTPDNFDLCVQVIKERSKE